MDLDPDPSIILGIRAQNLNWPQIACELVDNAIDAEATTVKIDFARGLSEVVVEDNGHGCDDLRRMLRQGSRKDAGVNAVGMYGVGGKHAMIWGGDVTVLRSVAAGIARSTTVDWKWLQHQPTWKVDDVIEEDAGLSPSGTSITLRRLYRLPDKQAGFARSLGVTYAPALRSGQLQILLRGPKQQEFKPIPPQPEPELIDAVTHEVVCSPGSRRRAHVKMGLLVRPEDMKCEGMTLALRGGRIMRPRTRIGIGSEPTPGLYGFAEIYPREAWGVNVHKDGVKDEAEAALGKAIRSYPPFLTLVARAHAAAQAVYLDQINDMLDLLAEEVRSHKRKRKARRNPPTNPTGTNPSTGKGSSHKRAARTQEGDTFPDDDQQKEQQRGIRLVRQDRLETDPLFDASGNNVTVNCRHPYYRLVNGETAVITPLAVLFWTTQQFLSGQQTFNLDEEVTRRTDQYAAQAGKMLACLASASARMQGPAEATA